MNDASVEKLEKELLAALSDNQKTENEVKILSRKYRTVIFGENYEATESVSDICSFCAKPEKDIEQFVTGVASLICNECIELCYEIIHEGKTKKDI